MAINAQDQLFIVDMTGRIQAFDRDGEYLHGWRTPAIESGKPCGLTFDRQGRLLVADTHYFRVLVYTPEGRLVDEDTIGGMCGNGPGEFTFVTDVVQDSKDNFYVCEYGDFDRVQKFDPQGQFVLQWGGHGSETGQFVQPRSLAIDDSDHIWVADACNHRIQVFDATGDEVKLVRCWGTEGREPGQLRYPYGLALDHQGHVYVAEFGNSRVQKFTVDGEFLASWGVPGRRDGELNQPWEIALDSQGCLHVLDTYNHRVQRIRL
jgi:DNA-binding beta-propeller fold protein YncE